MAIQIYAFGEVLWDVFPEGPRFGGAPANFACAVKELGRDAVDVQFVSAVGADELGSKAMQNLHSHNVGTGYLQVSPYATGTVLVELDEGKNASYSFTEEPAWDFLEVTASLSRAVASADVVYFGTLAQRHRKSRETIQNLLQLSQAARWRIFDLNLRLDFWTPEIIRHGLASANVLKLNEDELPMILQVLAIPTQSGLVETIQTMFLQCNLDVIALTLGAEGSLILNRHGVVSQVPAMPVVVENTVGAGDSFTAALALGLIDDLPLDWVHRWASEVAAFVCTQPSGTPMFPERLFMSRFQGV